ncbi:BMP family ABC transporter substrate-binding protein [Trinickia caryophylli]|uniref:Nucleoside-binding protein n=1 Tax=Trinickia caryophylli TaxID=28094 RepID=A0A1X7DM86_TRICW|nr:BMP family ABC transporter substrate-binding protein [Trinickia caryophylli]PMS10647.1 BMP family ABC transporter substrate-binding protein [Trinickia caryophylli]TRX17168.1 BMP family ABC transporter substrate-binding protein [Trinickia caryophylli]WQE12099.1 BMP family ABC transporter substrate-binding protein [Trinickia caryophylli]SMF18216.1 nucleoside-binding protein [Trinickia caryophylli]GLU31774.1 BMP family ABC transporter substrate-binding protein [Trinickia caryophylli]
MKRKTLTSLAGAAAMALACGFGPAARAADAPGVAFVYIGNPGDAGWTYAHDQGSKEAETRYGGKIKVTRVENVPESADSERVFRDLANKGNKVIVGTSFGYQDFELKVAKDFPDTVFLHATGFKKAPNFGTYDVRMYQGAYLAGIVAGSVTKTNTLGFVASVPIPEVVRNINAYTLGARSVNPKIHTKVVWINSWFDPGKEKQAAETLIGQGADVLLQNTDSSATLATAAAKKVHAFGWDSDMKKFGPDAHLGSVVGHWGVYYSAVIQQVLDGKWKNDPIWWGIPQKAVNLEDLNTSAISADSQKKVETMRAQIASGKWDVFTGPIKDQGGAVKVPAGKALSDAELQRLNWYVEGVDGSLPK